MNKLTEEFHELLRPKAALIAYHCMQPDQKYYLETRPISEDGKMGEGRPVSHAFMNRLVNAYKESYSGIPFGFIPERLLYCDNRMGQEKYIWFDPPGKRMMYFNKALGIENAEYHMPGIVYAVTKDILRVYAYMGKRKPHPKEKLFLGPFFNTSSSHVCLGTAYLNKPENPSYAELLEYWEKRFWLSEFSHLSGEGNPTKHNLVLVTKAARDRPFNPEELKPYGKTLEQLCL